MRKIFLTTFVLFSLMLAGLPARAALSVQSALSSSSNSNTIAPTISVSATTATNLNGLTINYYFYIGRLPISWDPASEVLTISSPAGFTGATMTVTRVNTATTNFNNGSNNTNANYAV